MKLKTKNTKQLLIVAISLSLSAVAHADFGIRAETGKVEEYKDPDKDVQLLLGLEYRGEKFNMGKSGISYDFTNSNKYAAEVLLSSKNYGYEASDSKTFSGMKKRNPSLDLGGRFIMDTRVGPAVLDVTKDVNSSKGFEAALKLGGITPHAAHWTGERNVTVAPAIGVRYQSAKTVDYFYGVKKTEATSARSAYKGKSAVTPFIGLEAQANITPHFSVNADLGVSKRAKSIKDSPLTNNKDHELGANIGITYWF